MCFSTKIFQSRSWRFLRFRLATGRPTYKLCHRIRGKIDIYKLWFTPINCILKNIFEYLLLIFFPHLIRFSPATLRRLYRGFKTECPSGEMCEDDFKQVTRLQMQIMMMIMMNNDDDDGCAGACQVLPRRARRLAVSEQRLRAPRVHHHGPGGLGHRQLRGQGATHFSRASHVWIIEFKTKVRKDFTITEMPHTYYVLCCCKPLL